MISKTPPFNGHKQQEFENMKRQLQVSKGIGGINHSEPQARESEGQYASNNGFSPSVPHSKGGLNPMHGTGGLSAGQHGILQNGPIKAMQMSMNNMDRVLGSQKQVGQKQNMNNSLNNFIQVKGVGKTNEKFDGMSKIQGKGLEKNDYSSSNIFVRDIHSKGSEKRASKY